MRRVALLGLTWVLAIFAAARPHPTYPIAKAIHDSELIVVAQARTEREAGSQSFRITRVIKGEHDPDLRVGFPKSTSTAPIDGERRWITPVWRRGTKVLMFLEGSSGAWRISEFGYAYARIDDTQKIPTIWCRYERINLGLEVPERLWRQAKKGRVALDAVIDEIRKHRLD